MNFYNFSDDEIRNVCKQTLESLEFWLRRLIHDSLSKDFGHNYIQAKKNESDYLIKSSIRKSILDRIEIEPNRFSRHIDASLLEHQIDIICNPELYNKYFSLPLKEAFPDGREEAKTFLKRLEYPRNCLYHANPISIRVSEQVVCYSHDVIESIKKYYHMNNQEKEYDVPTIIKFTDSFGNVFHKTDSNNIVFVDYSDKPECILYPGDILKIEIEIDPSYKSSKFQFRFGGTPQDYSDSNILIYKISESDPQPKKTIHCQVKSDRKWHRFSGRDDQITVFYKILPMK
jgi:hypothetical protein